MLKSKPFKIEVLVDGGIIHHGHVYGMDVVPETRLARLLRHHTAAELIPPIHYRYLKTCSGQVAAGYKAVWPSPNYHNIELPLTPWLLYEWVAQCLLCCFRPTFIGLLRLIRPSFYEFYHRINLLLKMDVLPMFPWDPSLLPSPF